jgi:ATP-dependent RNA/DNA helicase IGHMBP2
VGTVDSFQGQERGISAITLTRSNAQGEIGFLSDIRRMNVGMARERRKVLLVGDSSTLCRHTSTVHTFDVTRSAAARRFKEPVIPRC